MKRASGYISFLLAIFCFVLNFTADARPFDMRPEVWGAGGAGISNVVKSSEQVEIEGEMVPSIRFDYTAAAGNSTLEVWTSGNARFNVVVAPISIWVYGNGCNRALILRVSDESGEIFQFKGPTVSWSGTWEKVVFNDLSPSAAHSRWGGNNDGKIDGYLRLQAIGLDYWSNPSVENNFFQFAKIEVGLPEGIPPTPIQISGRVLEEKTGFTVPLSRAKVVITEKNYPAFTVTVTTDEDGYYVLPEIWGTQFTVTATLIGFTASSTEITVADSPYVVEDFILQRDFIGSEPDTWSDCWKESSQGHLFEVDTEVFYTGTGSIKGTGSEKESWIGTDYIPINPKSEYELSCWIKTEGISKEDGFNIALIQIPPDVDRDLGWWTGVKKVIRAGGTQNWTKYSVILPPPRPDAGRARIIVTLDAGVSGIAWLDNLIFRPIPTIVSLQADKTAISSVLNQEVTVEFEVTTGGFATLEVYDANNQLVNTVFEQVPVARTGSGKWDGKINGEPAPEGTYILRLTIVEGETEDSEEITVEVINRGPAATITFPEATDGEILQHNRAFIEIKGMVQIEYGATATVNVFRSVNGVEETVLTDVDVQSDGSFTCLVPLSDDGDAVNKIWVVAYDVLGNPGEQSNSFFIVYKPELLYGLVKVDNAKLISPKNTEGGKAELKISFYPSPATTSILEIKDAAGKIVFSEERIVQGEDEEVIFIWQGKNMEGEWVKDGFYTYVLTVTDGSQIDTALSDTIEVDNTPPAAPLLLYPQNGAKITGNKPVIRWKAIADAEYYLLAIGESGDWIKVTASEYALSVTLSKGTWSLKLKAVDKANNHSEVTEITFTITELDTTAFSVTNFMVGPNPMNLSSSGFRNQMAIAFTLQQPAKVKIVIYNLAGAVVRTIDLGSLDAGDQVVIWDGNDTKGRKVEAGAYLLRLEAFNLVAGGEVTLLRPILCVR